MSKQENKVQSTQHAFLVAWGWFAEHIGLPEQIETVILKQIRYHHRPQTKVLEFLVSILAGSKHLQDISLVAHPLDKDQAVAEAWKQPAWADYSGVSRTLNSLNRGEARQIVKVLDDINKVYIDTELQLLRSQGKSIQYDGDLTGIPVSKTSRTYPNAAFGHMDDEIRLRYQAAVVSSKSPTYGRLWLSGAHHPGDSVSCTQAEALVMAAEAHSGLHPWRRTNLLQKRIQTFKQQIPVSSCSNNAHALTTVSNSKRSEFAIMDSASFSKPSRKIRRDLYVREARDLSVYLCGRKSIIS